MDEATAQLDPVNREEFIKILKQINDDFNVTIIFIEHQLEGLLNVANRLIVMDEGKIVIEPQYADIDIIGKDNKSGFIVKDDTEKYGIRDYSNNQVLGTQYDEIQKIYGNDLYVVTVNGKQKLVNKENEDIITTGFDSIKQILSNQENAVIFKKDNKYGIINISKEEKLPFEYTSISYNEKADIYIAEDSNFNSNILNTNLENKITGILLELNENKGYIRIRVDDNYKYYNFKFEEKKESDIFPNKTLFLSKKDGKYGYVDKNEKVIVDYIYDDAIEQNDYGFAAIKKDGKWGSIDNRGNIVQEPVYNLDEYLLIDFIGRWHLGLDINMNYYNQL